ncbi:unnamed protein product [Effrenium voratum]|nr:unnamed protein product [Effrenium voratum]
MVTALEERQRQIHHRNSSLLQRRLGDLSPKAEAICSFDIVGVVLAVARTGTVLYFVQNSCKTQDTISQKAACAATIQGLFAMLGFLVSFLSDAIASCQATLNVPALCAAVSGNLVAVLSILGGSIASLENSCRAATQLADSDPEWFKYLKPPPGPGPPRRLNGTEFVLPAQGSVSKLPSLPLRETLSIEQIQEMRNKLSASEFRKAEIANCVFDVGLTSMFFGRGLLDLYSAAMHSPCNEGEKDFNGHTTDATSGCLVQVTGMITTFSFVASLIALLVSECPEGANVQALCASDAIVLIGSVSGLLQTGSSFVLVCGKVLDDHIDHIVEDVGTDIIP